jgi:hypothetical protein
MKNNQTKTNKEKIMINWKATKTEHELLTKISKRAYKLNPDSDYMTIEMDISACHLNGCPLKLKELLESDESNFGHDVFGIQRFINRDNGKLENCFLPRFSA